MSRVTITAASAAGALIVALVVALFTIVTVDRTRLARVQADAVAASLRALNVAAERDSTRDAALEHRALAGLLRDSLKVVETRVVQATQRGDALDRALGGERRAAYTMYMKADSLHRAVQAGSEAGERRAVFNVRQPPFTVRADVSIPPAPDTATMTLDVKTDSVRIDARVSCSKADAVGVRQATVDAAVPAWASLKFGAVQQAPEVCAGMGNQRAPGRRVIEFRRLIAGLGFVRGRTVWSVGAFVGAGIAISY